MKAKKLCTLLIGILMALVVFIPGVYAQDIPATNVTLTRDHAGIRRTEYNANPEFMVSVNVSPSDSTSEIAWESEDPDFVSVKPVQGQSHEAVVRVESWPKAQTVIKAYSTDNPEICDKMTVTVVSSRNDDVKEVRRLYGELAVDEKLDVTQDLAKELAGEKLTFETTDSSIASVNPSGLVTAKKPGVATIKTFNGDKTLYQSNVIRTTGTAVGSVPNATATKPEVTNVKATGLTLSHDHLGLCREENDPFPTAIVDAKLVPADANAEIVWESDNAGLAIVTPNSENSKEAVIKVVGWPSSMAKITAYVKDQPEIRDSLDLVVVSRRNDDVRLVHELYKQVESGTSSDLSNELVDDIKDDQLSWTSSNTDVATVDHSGVVKTYKPGVAKIQALGKQTNLAQQWELSVTSYEPTGISLNNTYINLCRDEKNANPTADITATLTPEGTSGKVLWESNDTGLATVTPVNEDGTKAQIKVVGWPAATTTITASLENNPEIKATATLVVASRRNDDVKLVQRESKAMVKGDEDNLASKLHTQLQGNNITWNSNNKEVATISDGTVKALKAGKATIRALNVDKNLSQEWEISVSAPKVEKVSLDQTSLNLEIGGTASLKATVTPDDAADKKVTWSSDKSSVVTVTDGKVKAVSAGSATITASVGEKFAKCIVDVTAPKVQKVSLDKTSLNLEVGDSAFLKATVTPDNAAIKTVNWKSDDTTVASVENGTVTAKGAGTATITATAGGITATCKVTVKEVEKPVEPEKEVVVDNQKSDVVQKDDQEPQEKIKEPEQVVIPEEQVETSKDQEPVFEPEVVEEKEEVTEETIVTTPEADETEDEVLNQTPEVDEELAEKEADTTVEKEVQEPEEAEDISEDLPVTPKQKKVEPEQKDSVSEKPVDDSRKSDSESEQNNQSKDSIVVPTIPMPSIPMNPITDSDTFVPTTPDPEDVVPSNYDEKVVAPEVEEPTVDDRYEETVDETPAEESKKVDNTNDNQVAPVVDDSQNQPKVDAPAQQEAPEVVEDDKAAEEAPASKETKTYRLFNAALNEHLFTTDENEAISLRNSGWTDEGQGWESPATGEAVYRLYSPITKEHHYTKDLNEVVTLKNNGWSIDNNGEALFYSGGSQPIYRLYNETTQRHHLTTDVNEYNTLQSQGWNAEGIALYSLS